jgi:hypothetical protein
MGLLLIAIRLYAAQLLWVAHLYSGHPALAGLSISAASCATRKCSCLCLLWAPLMGQ